MHRLSRLLLLAAPAAAALLISAGPVAATVVLPLHNSHEGANADDFESSGCAKDGQVPPAGTTRWVFVLQHNDADFVSLTLSFKTLAGTTTTITIPNAGDAYPDGITTNGTSKAWVITPSGWTLLTGSSVVSGPTTATYFNLTHTCVGVSTTPSPSPSTSTSPSSSPSVSHSGSPSESPSKSPSGSPSGSPSTSVSGGGSTEGTPSSTPGGGSPGGLPVTGTAIGGLVLAGVGAIGSGAALLWLRRRRDAIPLESEVTSE